MKSIAQLLALVVLLPVVAVAGAIAGVLLAIGGWFALLAALTL